ncbi:Probable serine/threonine-protein kinase SIS8 [Geodia barretti]|uniref:Probable serine/threonine-protein kinase SIS8 n=1 Tax=Geodia barretti TaxID=519541 RepID=A0AA35XDI1_GEOBA|nr:Probable serine/threonine-protein kinase SIS8 [Geodia barretti]
MEGLSACECPVCFLLLNHTTHEPMSMPCGHTLCKVCVDQLAGRASSTATRGGQTQRPTFQCPICRVWVNGDAVSLNVTLRDLLSELGRMDDKRVLPLGTALNVVYSEVVVQETLDRGAFGEVCRSTWRGNDVAVKLFSTGRPTPETMEAFQREVYVMNCLRHPNVVLLLGACQTPPKLAIIMEYVAGGSLHQLVHVDKTVLSESQIASLATDICRGLQYLHSINVLHRDLKSKNVLLTGPIPCQAKLCDFGLSRMRLESATMTGNIGTVHWTAPEVLNNERYKFSADVYGFGMVLYEMMCGRVPMGHMVPMAVMMAVAVRRERPAVPDNAHLTFKQLFSSCTEWVPEDRPSLPTILSSLSDLLPHPQTRGAGSQGARPPLQHQSSLGVVFLSATDSTDLMEQDSSLSRLARQNQATPTSNATPTASTNMLVTRQQSSPHRLDNDIKRNVLPEKERLPLNWSSDNKVAVSKLRKPAKKARAKYTGRGKLDLQRQQISESTVPVDEESERTSLNMATAVQQTPRAPHPEPRKTALGEGNAPWPRRQEKKVKKRIGEDKDVMLARELQAQHDVAQLQADRELAEQLQMKENSFQLPQATDPKTTPTSIFPPQPLLNSIKSKMFPQLKHVESTPTKEAPPTQSSLRRKLSSLIPRSFSTKPSPPPSSSPALSSSKEPVKPELVTTPRSKMAPRVRVREELPSYPNYQNIAGFSRYHEHTAPPVETHTVGAMAADSRPPPPPPPAVRRIPLSPQQLMLKDVRARGADVARKLRPVQTVEKRAFRVGHVVGGYDQQKYLYTTQNLIQSFSKRWLRPVAFVEPPPAFPVGR